MLVLFVFQKNSTGPMGASVARGEGSEFSMRTPQITTDNNNICCWSPSKQRTVWGSAGGHFWF